MRPEAVADFVRIAVPNQDESLLFAGSPRKAAGIMQHEFVAFVRITAARCRDAPHEVDDSPFVGREIESLDAVRMIAVVTVGNNTDSEIRYPGEQEMHGIDDVSSNLRQARVHGASGVERENEVDSVLHRCQALQEVVM
jgi:hypothetical protein